jgi:hypothetical protein
MLASRLAAPLVLVALTLAAGGCTRVEPVRAQEPVARPATFDHGALTAVLQAYVDARGLVDYARLAADADSVLTPYLQRLAATDPASLGDDARLAFWLNAYNAYALHLVVTKYPVESIRDIRPAPGPSVPKVNSPFLLDVGEVGGQVRSLDEIEHDIIRARFDEPRIHFALVCAALSCPRLRRTAYTGDRLDAQLDDQARTFLHNPAKNVVPAADGTTIRLSRIFKWFDGDFGGSKDATQRFLAPYFEGDVRRTLQGAGYEVAFRDYDWTLNDQRFAERLQALR